MRHWIRALLVPPADMPSAERERLRSRHELMLAFAVFVLAGVLTRVLFYLYDVGSALFIAVFSLNFLLLLAVAAVVMRNALKLVLDRRRGVLGARLRTRMTVAFMVMTLAPCLLMFLITMKFVQISVDFWFKDQISTSMEMALEVGRADYEKTGARLLHGGRRIIAEAAAEGILSDSQELNAFLERTQGRLPLALAGVLGTDRETICIYGNADARKAWLAGRDMINWDAVERQGSQTVLASGVLNDYVLVAQHMSGGRFFIAAENMGPLFKAKLERIASGAVEYRQLWTMRRSLKWMLYTGLSVLTMLIVLGAIWFGFRVAREISAPVLAVADAAQRIARGELAVRLDTRANDELGMLIRAFNAMSADLETFRVNLTGANTLLAEQNREISQHSQYVEAILNNITSGVVSVDEEGRVSMVNTAALAILRTSQAAVKGRELIGFLPEEMWQQARVMFEQFKNRPLSTWRRQVSMRLLGQEHHLLISVAGLVTPEGENRGFVAVFDDISEMERMQRMAAWSEVARRIAHEIKNPLTPIKLSAQRLQRKFGEQIEDASFTQSTELIVRQVESLQEMVEEFSTFAKLPEIHPKPGNIVPLLTEIVSFLRDSHTQIHWELDLPDSVPILPMDKNSLRRAFLNILGNAVDAVEHTAAPHVRVSAAVDTARAVLCVGVTDNGPGLTENERARLFEPYFSRKKGGTGLGLTIVRSIVADHKGYVRADTSPEGGATILVELPLM